MKRVFVLLTALTGLGGVLVVSNSGTAQPPAGPKPSTGKVAVFNYLKVIKDYQKYRAFADTMNKKKMDAMGPLSTQRTVILKLQEDIQKEPVATKRDEMTKTMVNEQRKFEDLERQVQTALDTESNQYLRVVYGEIQQCVKAIVDANGYDVVFAYPDAVDPKEMENPMYYGLKLQSRAAMPFYVNPNNDVTQTLVDTLNKFFPPPTPTGVAPAGGVAPPK